jgi:hypothetical protein
MPKSIDDAAFITAGVDDIALIVNDKSGICTTQHESLWGNKEAVGRGA